jgi:DNA-directed RNA polymerase subunit RPC12/RpoP
MKCEYCGRRILEGETTHGIKYGAVDQQETFIPARDSAWTVICSTCGIKVYNIVYMSLRNTSSKPTCLNTFKKAS